MERERDYVPYTTTAEGPQPDRSAVRDASKLLVIAQKMEAFINDNGWSWCDMERVYKILNTCHR